MSSNSNTVAAKTVSISIYSAAVVTLISKQYGSWNNKRI